MKSKMIVWMMSAFLCLSCLNLRAQGDLPMIGSQAEMLSYAMEQIKSVSGFAGTSLPSNAEAYIRVMLETSTEVSITKAISGMPLSVSVVNPNDWLYTSCSAQNKDGDTLFSGSRNFKLELAKGGYRLPENYGDVRMELSHEVPIKIPGAQFAQVSTLGPNGESSYLTSLQVTDGKVYFPRLLAGTTGVLSVYIQSPKGESGWQNWSMQDGLKMLPENFSVKISPSIKGIASAVDQPQVVVPVETFDGVGTNLTLEFHATKEISTRVSYYTTEGKWFTGAFVRKAGTTDWVYYPATIGKTSVYIDVPLPEGVYYMIPTWKEGDFREPEEHYYPPSHGGEKG